MLSHNFLSRMPGLFIIVFLGISKVFAQSAENFEIQGKKINTSVFNKEIDHLLNDVSVAGLSLAVIDDNKVVYYNNYGLKELAGGVKVDNATVFEAASLSKSFLVYVTHKLVDEGKLNLDVPVYSYFAYAPLEHDPRYKKITSRMLLSHSSGLENWKEYNDKDTLELLAAPGDKYIYSGEGYNYLALIIGRILGKTYSQYVDEVVIRPLNLKRVYSAFSTTGTPDNYAIGHDMWGKGFEKWKNKETSAASGMHCTAKAYAELISAIFDGKHLSPNRMHDIVKPVIKTSGEDPVLYYGAGFEVTYIGADTIISQGGSNNGFKHLIYYSIPQKRGFVIMTNSDQGKLLAGEINKLTVNLNITPYWATSTISLYPSNALFLLKQYRENGRTGMFHELESLRRGHELGSTTLMELAWLLKEKDLDLCRQLLEKNILLYPASSQSFWMLGKVYAHQQLYKEAYRFFIKAQKMGFVNAELLGDIKSCKLHLGIK